MEVKDMDEVKKLKILVEYGIPVLVLARECHCSITSIRNYISGASIPNGGKQIAIKDGLNHIVDTLAQIIKE